MSIISLNGVEKVYRTKEIETIALDNVNLDVDRGEFLSVMGPSGCGKSTLLNIIGLLDSPTKGTVSINDTDTHGMGDDSLARFRNSSIGFVFQSFHLIPHLAWPTTWSSLCSTARGYRPPNAAAWWSR